MFEDAIRLIKEFEGFRSRLYLDPVGFPTIGYGHRVINVEKWKGVVLTEEEAEKLLREDLLKFFLMTVPLVNVFMNEKMWSAVLSFVYNVGVHNFKISTMRKLINRREFRDAADEFPKWRFAGGKVLRGLVRRREAERELFLEGVEELIEIIQ